jgi:hypothetical protein
MHGKGKPAIMHELLIHIIKVIMNDDLKYLNRHKHSEEKPWK